jgi:HD-GYP domain-containing protein (c-di-GMP phosphodiesterase class II)
MPEATTDVDLYRRLLERAVKLFAEQDVSRLCEAILAEAQSLTGADGGTLYLMRAREEGQLLEFAILRNESLGMWQGGTSGNLIDVEPLPLWDMQGRVDHHHIAAHAVFSRQVVSVDDAYQAKGYDFSGARHFDEQHNYRTQSVLAIPLIAETGAVVGVIQLINARDDRAAVAAFDQSHITALEILCRFASVALSKQLVAGEQKAILTELSAEPNTERMLERILEEAQAMTYADAGTLYLLEEDEDENASLSFALMRNKSLNIYRGGSSGEKANLPPIMLKIDGEDNFRNVASYSAITKKVVNIADAYTEPKFDFSGTKTFDEKMGYRSQSFLTLPLLNHDDEVIGVLQLLNARDPLSDKVIPFDARIVPIVKGLATYAAIALNNRLLVRDLKSLLDAFIKCIAQAIDAKSPHTSGHCQRVPLLTEMIADAACQDTGTFADFGFNDDEWYELRVAAWMHDCGKLSTPDSVLDKSTKLHLMTDRINDIATRFAAKKSQILLAANGADVSAAISQLEQDLAFIETANKGGEFMAEESKARVKEIAAQTFEDAFGNQRPMLTEEEVYNLCIERGTLTHEERQVINNHMQVTIDMLESLPFPKKLRRVPEYAGGHHEKMDGSGFPKGLTRDEMSIPARMMAIADIFEALTAKDRPYKDPMKISQALSILNNMQKGDHIDPDLYRLFVEKRVWEDYAKQVLMPEQLDVDDVANWL